MNILERQNKELRELVKELVFLIDHGTFTNDVCCCGDNIDRHSMYSDHSPRDAGEHWATSSMDKAEALLEKHEAEILNLSPVTEHVDDTDYLGVYLQLKHAMERKPHAVTSRTTERAIWSAVQCLKIAYEKHGHKSDITT
jgi:hypothetical protein